MKDVWRPELTTMMSFSPTTCQVRAMERFDEFVQSDRQIFRMAGFAGTGKTTLAKYMLEKHYPVDRVAVAAYTNKACSVLRTKGFPQAGTIHNLIKRVMTVDTHEVEVIDGRREVIEKTDMLWFEKQTHRRLNRARILLIDETSMVPVQLATDLVAVAARYDIKIVALGDPFQLPPVNDTSKRPSPLDVGRSTDATLYTQTRTSEDSEILRTATALRTRSDIPAGSRGELYVTEDQGLIRDLADNYEGIQYLSYRNVTRLHTNDYVRDALWRRRGETKLPKTPIAGDVVTAMSTNHDTGVYMGEQYTISQIEKPRRGQRTLMATGSLVGGPSDVNRSLEIFVKDFEQNIRLGKLPRQSSIDDVKDTYPDASSFDFGYCMTVHRSQGSEWPNVCLLNEYPHERNRLEGARWLYTGITRASRQLYMWKSYVDFR